MKSLSNPLEIVRGMTIPVEVIWTPKALFNGLAGSYRVGGIYNTADDPNNQYDVAYGKGVVGEDRTFAGWIAIEQQLTSTGAGRQGLHSFANFTWHDRITNKVDNSQQVGLKYIGVFEQHPTDILGLGVNRVHLNERFTAGKAQYDYKAAKLNIVSEHAYSDGLRATVKCYGADDVQEGVAIMHHENVGVSITGNSTNPTRFQHPVAGTYKKECIEQGKKYFSVASGGGTGRTLHPDNMAAGPASYGMTDTMGRMHSDAQFAGSSSVPAHVEMMGLIGMGNNPMVGATVAVAVSVEEAHKAGKF
jgi:hypothetical protein